MPFPDTERVVYAINPLVEVVCQLRFPRALRIEAEKPVSFQEAIQDHYPVTKEQRLVGLRLSGAGAMVSNVHQMQNETSNIFDFSNPDNQTKVSLNSEFIAVSTNQYVDWSDFRAKLDFAFNTFVEIYRPRFFERIGLRYVNIIEPEKLGLGGAGWVDILSTNLNGVFAKLECPQDEIQSFDGAFQCQFKEADHFVTVRHGLVTNSATSVVGYKIDGDFWTQRRTEVKLDDVLTVLDRFRVGAGNLFRWSISPTLHKALGPTGGE